MKAVDSKYDERTVAALQLQKKQRLRALVHKRRKSLKYLSCVHDLSLPVEDRPLWLGVYCLYDDDLKSYVSDVVPKSRNDSFFNLGLAVAKVLEGTLSGMAFVRACSQMMEEWEYFTSGTAIQGVKFMMAKNANSPYPYFFNSNNNNNNNSNSASDNSPDIDTFVKSSLLKFNNKISFEFLHPFPCLPFEADYLETVVCLCKLLDGLYMRFLHEDCYKYEILYDHILRLDGRIKHFLISAVAKELTEFSIKYVKMDMNNIRNISGTAPVISQTIPDAIITIQPSDHSKNLDRPESHPPSKRNSRENSKDDQAFPRSHHHPDLSEHQQEQEAQGQRLQHDNSAVVFIDNIVHSRLTTPPSSPETSCNKK